MTALLKPRLFRRRPGRPSSLPLPRRSRNASSAVWLRCARWVMRRSPPSTFWRAARFTLRARRRCASATCIMPLPTISSAPSSARAAAMESNYLLEDLDLDLIAENVKPLIGYSDLTALHLWLLDQIQMPAFHGPMLSADFCARGRRTSAEPASGALRQAIRCGNARGHALPASRRARGTLYGGCLSILVAMLGTTYEPQTEGKLLFLEDVNAKPYQIDRMLWQLREAGKLEGVRGIVFGEMLDCTSPGAPPELLDQ